MRVQVLMLRSIVLVLLAVLLVACSGPGLSSRVVQRALMVQLQTATRQLNQQLQLPPAGSGPVEVNAVRVQQQEPLEIAGLPGYRVSGTCNLSLKVPGQRVQVRDTAFELYLQQQQEGKSWRLARPRPTDQTGVALRWELVPLSL